MLEALLMGVKTGQQYFPNSGPGNKTLKAGDVNIGYFGAVTSAELFNGWEVSTAVSLTAGSAFNDTNTTWLKFVYNGKFLFIAKEPVRRQLAWDDIYKAGAVYGVKGNGPYPTPGSPTDQWRIMVKKGSRGCCTLEACCSQH
jgi:hypothetical protein